MYILYVHIYVLHNVVVHCMLSLENPVLNYKSLIVAQFIRSNKRDQANSKIKRPLSKTDDQVSLCISQQHFNVKNNLLLIHSVEFWVVKFSSEGYRNFGRLFCFLNIGNRKSFEFKLDDTRLSSYYKNKIGPIKKYIYCILTLQRHDEIR